MTILLVVGSRHMCLALELSGGCERRAVRDVADECNSRSKIGNFRIIAKSRDTAPTFAMAVVGMIAAVRESLQ